jgi:hypothetical protein
MAARAERARRAHPREPQAAEVVKKYGQILLTRVPYTTPSNQCWPGGVQFVLYNIRMQMLQQPDKITILCSNDHEVRHVRMNQPHPAARDARPGMEIPWAITKATRW